MALKLVFNPLTGKFDYINTGAQGAAGANGIMVWDEGVPVGTGFVLNFIGANVEASLSGSVIRVFVTGSSGGGGMTHPQVMARVGLR
jgi:predicted enzyme related to lactoylglutathione lyase